MVRRYGLVALFIAASFVMLSACGKPKAGAKCVSGQSACVDAKSGLFCSSDGTFKAMTCGGPSGCQQQGAKVSCDNDVATAGDGCDTPNDGACTADHKVLLLCKNQVFGPIDTCKGPGGCKLAGDMINCDNDIADIGDPCSNDGNFACTSDHGMALRCQTGKYAAIQSCSGPKSCNIIHPKPKTTDIDCDFTVAKENDPCFFPDNESCTSDKKTRLTCKGGKYVEPLPCPGPNGCTVTVTAKSAKVTCDTGDSGGKGGGGGKGGKKGKKH
jgi:hypothetical protein